ncbi:NAD(P)-dependent oxidoreductase [Jiangella ureilytica]|uniref:NAD(P)-dependent oxidoreductase n=1 Tax=Jiangella ureilytica TaxID=2530374 RepID=A0A4V2XXN4_9ACTN|nr:NAD(P)-binding domain-containing protein [Jiangella ureilytica]TDC53565.1 NAD(P)-dependent oxidoreductase [Jiangella ureilytica]
MTTSPQVTVLGLGNMGRALAKAFLAHGHPTTVWNRSPEKGAEVVAAGATRAATVADAVRTADLVVVCVVDYKVARQLLEPAAAALRGRTVVNLTADSPGAARDLAAWAAEHGIDYLDGSIMTPTITIDTPDAVLIYSGPAGLYQRHAPTLAALGGRQHHLGADPGRAAAFDVALLDLFWTAVSGLTHAFALAKAEGVDGADLAPFATSIAGLLASSVDELAERVDHDRHDADVATLETVAAGLAHVIEAADRRGLDTSVQRAAHAQMRRVIDAGHGADDVSRLSAALLPGG